MLYAGRKPDGLTAQDKVLSGTGNYWQRRCVSKVGGKSKRTDTGRAHTEAAAIIPSGLGRIGPSRTLHLAPAALGDEKSSPLGRKNIHLNKPHFKIPH